MGSFAGALVAMFLMKWIDNFFNEAGDPFGCMPFAVLIALIFATALGGVAEWCVWHVRFS